MLSKLFKKKPICPSPDVCFDEALKTTLKHEGGYVNHPNDPGGETNYGITIKVARAAGYNGPMKKIPMDTVSAIYKVRYWNLLQCGRIASGSPEIAKYLFDIGVNCGVARAGKWLQNGINSLNRGSRNDLVVDGKIGGRSIAAFLELSGKDLKKLLLILKILRGHHYVHLAITSKKFRTFIRGWLNRV